MYHPCQALADMLTLKEHFGSCKGLKLAFVGDGNNVAHSLMLCAARLGMQMTVATPTGYEPKPEIVAASARRSAWSSAEIEVTNDPAQAVKARTRSTPTCGQAWARKPKRTSASKLFAPYQVNEALMSQSARERRDVHALPARQARRGSDG